MDTPVRKRIGDILIERGKLDAATLERALRLQQESGERLGALLVTLGVVAQRDVAEALAAQLDAAAGRRGELPGISDPRGDGQHAVPARDARAAAVARTTPRSRSRWPTRPTRYTIGAFEMVTGRTVRPMVAIPTELEAALERLYGTGKSAQSQVIGDVETRVDELAFDADVQQLKDLASEAPVIRLVSLLITNALDMRASDIHVEPFENRLAVRYRVDGVLHDVESPPEAPRRRGDLADQDHGEPRHRRAPAAAGRPHPAARAGQGDRPARVDGADDARRIGRDADPRQGRRRARLREAGLRRRHAEARSSTC